MYASTHTLVQKFSSTMEVKKKKNCGQELSSIVATVEYIFSSESAC